MAHIRNHTIEGMQRPSIIQSMSGLELEFDGSEANLTPMGNFLNFAFD